MTPTHERFTTKAEAFDYSASHGGVIMRNAVIDRAVGQSLGRLIFTDWYVVGFETIEAAYAAGMEIETFLDDLD